MKTKKTKQVRLGNARLIWRSEPEVGTVGDTEVRSYCFKLPANSQGVLELTDLDGDELLHVLDPEQDETKATFLLAGGGRAFFSRRFYAGRQVGAQLLVRDYPGPLVEAFGCRVLVEG